MDYEVAPSIRPTDSIGHQMGLHRCSTPSCGRWLGDPSRGAPIHRCHHGREFEQIRREMFRDTFSVSSPTSLVIDFDQTFEGLIHLAMIRQAALLERGASCAPESAGIDAALAWYTTAADWRPFGPDELASGPVLATAGPDVGHYLPDLFRRVIEACIEAVITQVEVRHRSSATTPIALAALNSLAILEDAAAIDIAHWWSADPCTCDRSHAWIAPLLGWVEMSTIE